jgi:hypothetical protein
MSLFSRWRILVINCADVTAAVTAASNTGENGDTSAAVGGLLLLILLRTLLFFPPPVRNEAVAAVAFILWRVPVGEVLSFWLRRRSRVGDEPI